MDENDKIKQKMDAIWKARDNEAGAVKERSLLVWGFLMFCYTGYACLAAKVILNCGKNGKELCDSHLAIINIVLLLLSLIAFRLSLNWVRMMKGAAAWAQNYDYLAENFQHLFLPLRTAQRSCPLYQSKVLTDKEKQTLAEIKSDKNCEECQGDPSYACIFSVTDPTLGYYPDLDENALSTNAGPYSPAKVTIAIARMSLIIAMFLSLAHLLVVCFGIDSCRQFIIGYKDWAKWCAIALVCILAGFPLLHLTSRFRVIRSLLNILSMNDTESMGLHDIQKFRNINAPQTRREV